MERRNVSRQAGVAPDGQEDLEQEPAHRQGGLGDDKINVCILLFLYVLQGIPLGLAGSIPMILQNHHVSYKDQAVFSFVNWPFSIKLLWAPAVDSLFWRRLGRRKTWLIPTQYLIGLFMVLLSSSVASLLGEDGGHPNVYLLTTLFFCMNFLAATQDIAVDGWALTMLSRRNVSYASTCNSVGQTAGYFLGNVVFLALESADFCNKYLRIVPQEEGLVTLSSFLKFWGVIFFITTTLVLLFKTEKEERISDEIGIRDTYVKLYRILCLRNMWLMVAFLLTCKVAFAATDAVTGLKLIEAGVQKENLALFAVPMVPLQILLPFLISKYTAGPRPLSVFLTAYPFRLAFGLLFAALLWWTHQVKLESGGFPVYYYIVILSAFALQQVTVYGMFVALMAFFANVSDPAIGGTYMTLLNTVCNLGGNWPSTTALWMVDALTFKACSEPTLSCDTKELAAKCVESGHECLIRADGYYVETVACILFGFLWLRWGRGAVRRLQNLPPSAWKCPR
ncbi:acetyl-coenzyme A transporter 1-like isoform X2 [Uloborus diversus]|uniref:acetyl-coenzyme A transporter 1-like isoform X2 n=1 Tax=Uloborus diversus TaxID=327109 RepID=UPI00240A8D43|nr:acetyl-coenzyme A transporter 1-like isoform X2 [Uloborus diversus]